MVVLLFFVLATVGCRGIPCHNPVLASQNWYCVTTFDKVGLTVPL